MNWVGTSISALSLSAQSRCLPGLHTSSLMLEAQSTNSFSPAQRSSSSGTIKRNSLDTLSILEYVLLTFERSAGVYTKSSQHALKSDRSSNVGKYLQIRSTWTKNRLLGQVLIANCLLLLSRDRGSPLNSSTGDPRSRESRDRKSTRLNSSHLGISYA